MRLKFGAEDHAPTIAHASPVSENEDLRTRVIALAREWRARGETARGASARAGREEDQCALEGQAETYEVCANALEAASDASGSENERK